MSSGSDSDRPRNKTFPFHSCRVVSPVVLIFPQRDKFIRNMSHWHWQPTVTHLSPRNWKFDAEFNLNVSCLWCLSKWRSCWLRVSSSSNVSDSQQTLFPPARRIINYSTALSSAVRHRVIAIKWKLIFIYDSPDTSKYLQATLVLIPIASQG